MRELMGRSWEDIDDVPVVGDMDKEARLIGRSPSPVDVDDAFGGFDSVVLGNLLQKNEVFIPTISFITMFADIFRFLFVVFIIFRWQ